jgi:predicted peroxiredoxin
VSALGIILISGGHERAHYALMLATAAAAIGREVTVFATSAGTRALLAERPLEADPREAEVVAAGVAPLGALLEAAQELGVALMVCDAGLATEGLRGAALLPGVEVSGLVGFLARIGAGAQSFTL